MTSRSSPLARYLVVVYAFVVAYASLHPLGGWRDRGLSPFAFLASPLPTYWTAFDVAANVAAYFPLGFLIVAALHPLLRGKAAAAVAAVACFALSLGLETLQTYLPARIPSNLDLASNIAGGIAGAVTAAALFPRLLSAGGVAALRRHLFRPGHTIDLGLVVIGLWLLSQLNPETLLFGNGDLREYFATLPAQVYPPELFVRLEALAVAANTLAVALLVAALANPGAAARRIAFVLVLAALLVRSVAFGVLFSPADTFAWLTPGALLGLAAGFLTALLALALSRPVAIALGGLALMGATVVVNITPWNPYLAHALATWHQGHFLNFNGLTRLVSAIWPFAALFYLLLLARRR